MSEWSGGGGVYIYRGVWGVYVRYCVGGGGEQAMG